MEKEHIPDGAFQVARKMFDGEFWRNKPSSWKVIWIYILGNVNHRKLGGYDRGENYFNLQKEMGLIGRDITHDSIKKFCAYAKKHKMISTSRSSRGMRIKVLNYNKYQTLDNYKPPNRSTSEALQKHPDKQEGKNIKSSSYKKSSFSKEISSLTRGLRNKMQVT